jgi:ketosteroid isomerase-like protein
MNETNSSVEEFFDRYAAALLARDAAAIARMYAVPSLILFPDNSIPVTDEQQTEQFFATTWAQYEGVDSLDHDIRILGEAPHSVWADVTWSWDGQPRERLCYQLVGSGDDQRIAVLTPMQ